MKNAQPLQAPSLTGDDWQHIDAGIALYNSQQFWEAHEAWEVVWRRYSASWRLLLQGLIQMSAGFYQLRRNIYHGTVKHLRNARRKLVLFPDGFLGLNLAELIAGIDATLAEVETAGRSRIHEISTQRFPRIRLTTGHFFFGR